MKSRANPIRIDAEDQRQPVTASQRDGATRRQPVTASQRAPTRRNGVPEGRRNQTPRRRNAKISANPTSQRDAATRRQDQRNP